MMLAHMDKKAIITPPKQNDYSILYGVNFNWLQKVVISTLGL